MLCSSISYSITFRLNLTFVTRLSNDDKKKTEAFNFNCNFMLISVFKSLHWYWSPIKGRARDILITFFCFSGKLYELLCVMFDDWSSFRREIFFISRSKKKSQSFEWTGQLDWKVFNHLVLTTNIKPLSNYLIDNDSFVWRWKQNFSDNYNSVQNAIFHHAFVVDNGAIQVIFNVFFLFVCLFLVSTDPFRGDQE